MVEFGCSIRSSYSSLRALPVRYPTNSVVTYFVELDDSLGQAPSGGTPIGVFTVLRRGKRTKFHDGIHLAPTFDSLWKEALSLALAEIGSGSFEYGWVWSLEPPRESLLQRTNGVVIKKCYRTVVYAIDFSKFGSWNEYYSSISENVRRNYKKAIKKIETLRYEQAHGVAALPIMLGFVTVRRALGMRKTLPGNVFRAAMGFLGKIVLSPNESFFVRACEGDRTLAAMRIGRFGPMTYYFDGATAGRDDGSGWFLMIEALKEAYQRFPKGKFLLGWHLPGSEADAGLERSRAALRPEVLETVLVDFDWSPPVAATDVVVLADRRAA